MTYTLTGSYVHGDGSARVGRLKFEPSVAITDGATVVLPSPVSIALDAAGAFTVALVGTDDGDYSPSGWVWTVVEAMDGGRTWSFELTADADIGDLSPTAVPGEYDTFALLATDMIAGAGLTGGGDLSADRTFTVGAGAGVTVNADDVAVTFGTTSGTVMEGNAAPNTHAASHASAGSDPVTVAQSQVADLGTDLGAKAPLASPTLTGTVTIPTPDAGSATTVAATTAFAAERATIGNLLTDNQASGTDTLGTTAGFSGSLATLASVVSGSGRALQVTLTGTGSAIGAYTTPATPVSAGQVITTMANWTNVVGSRAAYPRLIFNNGQANGPYAGINGETTVSFSAVVPAGATSVQAFWVAGSAGSVGDQYLLDNLSLHVGAGGNWAMPGTPITGLGTRITRPNVDDRLVEQWNGSAWSVVDYDSGWRDISGSLANGFTGTVHMRRVNLRITLRLFPLTAPGSQTTFYNPGLGWRPASYMTVGVAYGSAGFAKVSANGPTNLDAAITTGATLTAGLSLYGEVSWSVYTDLLPTSLPGVLVPPAGP